MTLPVFAAILVAALLHAVWNAFVRGDTDRGAAATAIAGGGILVGIVVLPFVPAISLDAVPYFCGSSFIHVAYFALVARAYDHGELSVAYPIMRGLAPLIATMLAAIFVETPAFPVVLGIVVVAVGIVTLGVDGMRRKSGSIVPALINAGVIALYTLVDGLGARASGAPVTYTAWLMVGSGVLTVLFQFWRRGPTTLAPLLVARVVPGLAGGAMSFGAYAIALWAMTFAPIGAVAAVRESSVLFATAIGAVFLGERFGLTRWIAALLVVAGLALVKFGG